FFVTLMDISYKAKQLDQLLIENQFDAMTSIFNRATFESELHKQQQRAYREQALFIIDLDNFKQVNDDYGHQTGDYLLMKIGENFKKITHQHQILFGRLGGDEFVAYLSSDELADEIVAVSKQIMSQLTIKVQDITITASCGIVYDQQNQLDFQALYTLADQTMYAVKNNQKNNFKITIINEN
ncbi:MAG: GGDEF domain-containing protein, partial [Culicoidibacterales bacterium]